MNELSMKPLVGICIPAYENVNLLKRAVESSLKQDYKEFIIVITDDSNTDSVRDYIMGLGTDKIKYVHNDKRLGATENTNNAVRIAIQSGAELIKLLFQDDWFENDKALSKMVQTQRQTGVAVVFCGNVENYSLESSLHVCGQDEIELINKDKTYLFISNVLGAPSNILYKSCDVRLDGRYTWLLDIEFYMRLIGDGKIAYVYEPLIAIGHDGDQLSDYYMKHPFRMFGEKLLLFIERKDLHTKSCCKHLIDYFIMCCKVSLRNRSR